MFLHAFFFPSKRSENTLVFDLAIRAMVLSTTISSLLRTLTIARTSSDGKLSLVLFLVEVGHSLQLDLLRCSPVLLRRGGKRLSLPVQEKGYFLYLRPLFTCLQWGA